MNKIQEVVKAIVQIIQLTGQPWQEVIAEVEKNMKERV